MIGGKDERRAARVQRPKDLKRTSGRRGGETGARRADRHKETMDALQTQAMRGQRTPSVSSACRLDEEQTV